MKQVVYSDYPLINTSEYKEINGYITKDFENVLWLRIFHHDLFRSKDDLFNSKTAKYSVSKHMFSILGLIDEDFLFNNVYEFLIEYPQMPSYTRFNQSLNPNSNGTGIVYKHISGNKSYYFSGLSLSQDPNAYIDGTSNSGKHNWRFAIGAYDIWNGEYIPGPIGYNADYCSIKWVDLWIRIEIHYDMELKNGFCS